MTELEIFAEDIFSRYGAITRARGSFLYTKKTVRLTDLYREGGRAILGWGGGAAFTALKNTLNRGITGSFRTELSAQLPRAVSALLDGKKGGEPSRTVYVCASDKEIYSTIGKDIPVYRPWDYEQTDYSAKDAVIIAPPFPWATQIVLLAVRKGCASGATALTNAALQAPITAGVCRSIYDLIKAQSEMQEKDFYIYDPVLTRYWLRKGPWLLPKVPREVYRDFVRHCLDCAIAISPIYDTPSIVPFVKYF